MIARHEIEKEIEKFEIFKRNKKYNNEIIIISATQKVRFEYSKNTN